MTFPSETPGGFDPNSPTTLRNLVLLQPRFTVAGETGEPEQVCALCIARLMILFLTCDKELLGEGATVESCDLLLQAHSQNA